VDRARALWEGIVARAAPPPFERTARVRLAGLSLQGAPAAAVTSYFEARGPARLRALREGAAHGGWAVAYLLGRALAQEGVASEALDALEGAVAFPDCPRVVAQEARRLAQEAASQAGRCERLEAFAADASLGGGLQTRARDWLERCRFH
jgi:hypothetical protein